LRKTFCGFCRQNPARGLTAALSLSRFVVQDVVAQFIELTGKPAGPCCVCVNGFLEAYPSAQPTRPFMLRHVAPVEPALEQVIRAVDQHPGNKSARLVESSGFNVTISFSSSLSQA